MTDQFQNHAVLLVDDDDSVREFMAACLSAIGLHVTQARSGHEAIELCRSGESQYHLVLTDMVMPGLFGDQMALRLWELIPNLKIIFMSGNPPGSLEPGVTLEEGKNFLRKPFSLVDLQSTLQAQLGSLVSAQSSDTRG